MVLSFVPKQFPMFGYMGSVFAWYSLTPRILLEESGSHWKNQPKGN